MFGLLRSPSQSAKGAIGYVTIGVLLIIWSGLWYYYFLRPDPNPPIWHRYVCMGIIFSGVAISTIGILFGLIGRGAKMADNTVGVATTTPMASVSPVTTLNTPGVNQPVIVQDPGLVGAPSLPTPIPAGLR